MKRYVLLDHFDRQALAKRVLQILPVKADAYVNDPNLVRITNEADEMLTTICSISNCGRSGIVDVAIRILADKFLENDEKVLQLITEAVNNRSFTDILRDKLEQV